jgi:hypothetical protein
MQPAGAGSRMRERRFCWCLSRDAWHFGKAQRCSLDIEEAIKHFRSQFKAKKFKATEKLLAKAHIKDSMQALRKLTTMEEGRRRIISDSLMIVPVEEVFADVQADAIYQQARGVLGKYRRSLQSGRKHLLEEFTPVQVARKVIGVGSVGTRACC